MAMTDEQLAQQVHDAYDTIKLDDQVQSSMLANLLAAQAAAQEPQVEERAEERHDAEVIRMPRRRWTVLLPVAAVLVAALIVVRTGAFSLGGTNAAQESSADIKVDAAGEYAAEESVAYDASEMADVDAADAGVLDVSATGAAASNAPEAKEDVALSEEASAAGAEGVSLPELYPTVTLSDGTQLTVRAEQVEASGVARDLEQTSASSPDGQEAVPCTVCELADGGLAVRYDAESTYWLCD